MGKSVEIKEARRKCEYESANEESAHTQFVLHTSALRKIGKIY